MDNVVPLKAEIGHNLPHTPEQWRAYISEATTLERSADQSKVAAIIEKGKRIAEFHAYFNDHKKDFNKSWVEACKEIVGVNDRVCSDYETVAETFSDSIGNGFLPPNINCLVDLARAIKAHRKTFNDAVSTGEVHPSMDRNTAKEVARRAAVNAKGAEPQIVTLVKAGHTPTQIARKLGMMTGNPREDRNAGVRVARELRKLGYRTGSPSKRKKLPRPKVTTNPMHRPGIKAFFANSPSADERVGLDPVQRTHLHPFAVKQMIAAQSATHELAVTVIKAASAVVDPARFFEQIDQMLAWTPDKTREGTGWDTDYAAKAKKTLAALDKHLAKAIDQLTDLQARLKARADEITSA